MWVIKRLGSSAFCAASGAGEAAEFAGCSTEEMELVFASVSESTIEVKIKDVAYELRRLSLVSSPSAPAEFVFGNMELGGGAGTRCASPPNVAKISALPSTPASPAESLPRPSPVRAEPFSFAPPIFGIYTPPRGPVRREPPPLARIKRSRSVREKLAYISEDSSASSPVDLTGGDVYARASPETVRELGFETVRFKQDNSDEIEVVERGIRRKRRAPAPTPTDDGVVESSAAEL